MAAADRSAEGARALLAPDSFKGTLSAGEVAGAMLRGARGAGVRAEICPLADGGEGTLDVLASALGATIARARASDPLGRPLTAEIALLDGGETAVVEVARTSGLTLVEPEERDAVAATTRGAGELIVAAVRMGARRVLVGAGGSASTDGGAGALAAIAEAGGIGDVTLTVLCDVDTPFELAAAVFAPQKGADEAAVAHLARRLDTFADGLPRDPRGMAMTGCAGGLSGGLWAQHGAELVSGAGFVLDAVGFDERALEAGLVLTGEGCLDRQSFEGKLVGGVVARCARAQVPVHVIVGAVDLPASTLERAGVSSVRLGGDPSAIESAAAEILAGRTEAGSTGPG